jgi:hypothetical protein
MEVSSTMDPDVGGGVAQSERRVGGGRPGDDPPAVADAGVGCSTAPPEARCDGGGVSDDDDDGTGDTPDGFDEDGFDEDGFDEELFDDDPLDEHETSLVRDDLAALADFQATFGPEGFRGVAVWCHDCVEEHYFPWDMLRENLQLLLETGETPVHEPAYQPEPHRYVPWDYARGYVDALRDVGVPDRLQVDRCPRCELELPDQVRQANFCPRCGTTLLSARLVRALVDLGLDDETVSSFLTLVGVHVLADPDVRKEEP